MQQNKNSNLTMGLIIFQEQSLPSGQNLQLDGQELFCPDVSAGHFQKLF